MRLRSPHARGSVRRQDALRGAIVRLGFLAAGLGIAAGCGAKAKLPRTVPVRGKVVYRDGTPFSGGQIQFQSKTNPAVAASSTITADGNFELNSFMAGAAAPGAMAGSHRVLVIPQMDENHRLVPPIPPQTITVAEGENNLTITVEKPPVPAPPRHSAGDLRALGKGK